MVLPLNYWGLPLHTLMSVDLCIFIDTFLGTSSSNFPIIKRIWRALMWLWTCCNLFRFWPVRRGWRVWCIHGAGGRSICCSDGRTIFFETLGSNTAWTRRRRLCLGMDILGKLLGWTGDLEVWKHRTELHIDNIYMDRFIRKGFNFTLRVLIAFTKLRLKKEDWWAARDFVY